MSLTKVNTGTGPYSINEHWTATTEGELQTEFFYQCRQYHPAGYGTSLRNVKQDPTGLLWHAEFYRSLSCD